MKFLSKILKPKQQAKAPNTEKPNPVNPNRAGASGPATPNPQMSNLKDVQTIIAVASGKGGVGKSTMTVSLAYSLAKQGAKVGILDADVYGPSISKMTTVTQKEWTGDNSKIQPLEADGIKVLSLGMFDQGKRAAILRGPMAANLLRQFLVNTEWGDLDYLLIDCPPGTGDIPLTLAQSAPLDGAVIITTPQEVCGIDVCKSVEMFQSLKIPILGFIETMSYFVAPDTGKKYELFGEGGGKKLATKYNSELLGQIPIDPAIAKGGDSGRTHILADVSSPSSQAAIKAAQKLAAKISIAKISAQGANAVGSGLSSFSLEWKKFPE